MLMNGILTPVQMEGLRLLLTPFPQEEFNQTEDRKVAQQSLGVTCLDCHANFHTNGAFHLTPDVRPQSARFRLDTTSLRGLFNQQIHGSKRSLRSVEDFTEFEQRTAYFNGDHVSATRKGVNLPDRPNHVAMMAQMQNIIDFPPAPKLDPFGRLDPTMASDEELKGRTGVHGQGALRRVPRSAAVVPGQQHARPQAGTLLQDRADGQRSGDAAGRPNQDLYPARHQRHTTLYARWTAAHARRHRGVLQPRPGHQARPAGEECLGRVSAHALNSPEQIMKNTAHCVVLAALSPAVALAQIGNPAGMAPDTRFDRPGVPAPHQTNYQDRLFAQLASSGGQAEVEFGKLAESKADSAKVKEFASRMIHDHTE